MSLTPEEEFEGLTRTHTLDDAKFIAFVKTAIKGTKMRVNKYIISPLIDGKMLKLEVEAFTKTNKSKGIIGGISKGTRSVKGYLSEEKCNELVALLDKIPRKVYQDTRTKENIERPQKIISDKKGNLKELDLDNLFDD
jgi:hypothetical protein